MPISQNDFSDAIKKVHKHQNNIIENISEINKKIFYKNKAISFEEINISKIYDKMQSIEENNVINENNYIICFDEKTKTIKRIAISEIKRQIDEQCSMLLIGTFSTGINLDQTKKIDCTFTKSFANSSSFGELIESKSQLASFSSKVKCFFAGGKNYVVNGVEQVGFSQSIEFVNFASKSNGQNFSTLKTTHPQSNGIGNSLFGFVGGQTNFEKADKIDYATQNCSTSYNGINGEITADHLNFIIVKSTYASSQISFVNQSTLSSYFSGIKFSLKASGTGCMLASSKTKTLIKKSSGNEIFTHASKISSQDGTSTNPNACSISDLIFPQEICSMSGCEDDVFIVTSDNLIQKYNFISKTQFCIFSDLTNFNSEYKNRTINNNSHSGLSF